MADKAEGGRSDGVYDFLRRLEEKQASANPSYGGRGGGPKDPMIERVEALEAGQKTILSKLDEIAKSIADGRLENEKRFSGIDGRLIGIEKTLDSKASAEKLESLSKEMHLGVQSIDRDLRTKATSLDLGPLKEKIGAVEAGLKDKPGIAAMITLVISTVSLSLGGAAALAYTLVKYLRP